jgi:hypothetical protein
MKAFIAGKKIQADFPCAESHQKCLFLEEKAK